MVYNEPGFPKGLFRHRRSIPSGTGTHRVPCPRTAGFLGLVPRLVARILRAGAFFRSRSHFLPVKSAACTDEVQTLDWTVPDRSLTRCISARTITHRNWAMRNSFDISCRLRESYFTDFYPKRDPSWGEIAGAKRSRKTLFRKCGLRDGLRIEFHEI